MFILKTCPCVLCVNVWSKIQIITHTALTEVAGWRSGWSFSCGISLVWEPLGLYILPGTISLSLHILSANHYSQSMTMTDDYGQASVLTFPIIHFFFRPSIHFLHYICPILSRILKFFMSLRSWESLILKASNWPKCCWANPVLLSVSPHPVQSLAQETNNLLPVSDTGRGRPRSPCLKGECTCTHEPKHNDYSAITEVIKTSADHYHCRQREWRGIIQPQGICETLEQICTDTQTKLLPERVGDPTYHSHYF